MVLAPRTERSRGRQRCGSWRTLQPG